MIDPAITLWSINIRFCRRRDRTTINYLLTEAFTYPYTEWINPEYNTIVLDIHIQNFSMMNIQRDYIDTN